MLKALKSADRYQDTQERIDEWRGISTFCRPLSSRRTQVWFADESARGSSRFALKSQHFCAS